MLRNQPLGSAVAIAGVTLGASLAAPGLSSAVASTKAPTLPRVLTAHASTSGETGLGPILQALSQVKGIKGTQVGDDLSTLGADLSNEDPVVNTNLIDGLHKLQANSASDPTPFNTLLDSLAAALLKDAGSSTPAVSTQRSSTKTSTLSVQNILRSL
jgi:hypothetical protein